jgi:hypothetical protein
MKKFYLFMMAAMCCGMAVSAANYDIKIAGITVTDANKANVMGDGKVSYDPASNTVTLNGASIDLEDGNFAIDCNYSKKLTIVLKSNSDNFMSVSHMMTANDAAIMSMGPITITSEENPGYVAKLKIVTYGTAELYANQGDIRIEGPIEVTLNGSGNNNTGNVYNAFGGKFIIDGATVNMYPCRIRTGATTITRSAITKPATAVLAEDGKIIRSGATTEFDNTTMVTVSSQLHKIYLGPDPQNSGHSVSHDEEQPSTKRYYIWAAEGQILELWSYPAKGYRLNGWYTPNPETLIGKTNPFNFTMPAADTIVYAKFEKDVKEVTVDDIIYEVDPYNKVAAVKTVKNPSLSELVVRDKIAYQNEDYPVTSLAEMAFANANVQFIDLPASLLSIGKQAFVGCSNLLEITYMTPSKVALKASDKVFDGLTTANIKLRVRRDKASEFRSAEVWKDFEILEIEEDEVSGLRYIYNSGTNTYSYTYGVLEHNYDFILEPCTLSSVYKGIPVTSISDYAFMHSVFEEVYIDGNNIEYIGQGAFAYCYGLEKVRFANSIKEIDQYAFYACEDLNEAILPDKLEKLGHSAFDKCYGLLSISLPAGLKWMGEDVFAYCDKLEYIINYAEDPLAIDDNVFFLVNNRSSIELYVPYGSKEKYEDTDVWQDFDIIEMAPTGVENVQRDDVQCTKVIENGVLYLKNKGTKYNVLGQMME